MVCLCVTYVNSLHWGDVYTLRGYINLTTTNNCSNLNSPGFGRYTAADSKIFSFLCEMMRIRTYYVYSFLHACTSLAIFVLLTEFIN